MPLPTVESTAAPLPFLVEHGAWIWKALIGLAAVGAPGLARLRRRRQAATHVARVVRGATVELRSGQTALRGRLSDADLRSSRQLVWGYAAPHVTAESAGGAALTVGDTRVHHTLTKTDQTVLGVAPLLQAGRAELVEALQWSPRLASRSLDGESLVAATLRRAFVRRSILRLLGRDDLAAPDAAIVARVVEVLADRDKVLALAFWGAR